MNNIFAHTEPQHSLPAYVSLNDRDGVAELSVRTRGQEYASTIPLTDEQLEKLADQIQIYLWGKGKSQS